MLRTATNSARRPIRLSFLARPLQPLQFRPWHQLRRASYQYLHFQPLQPQASRLKKFLVFNLALVSATALAYYFWWPHHTFPLSVAQILRKGLWAESDRGEKDFQLALKHYLEALEECDRLHMDQLCDEYTGIQLKVAEMYERLDMMDEAAFVFNEIATLYLSVLKAQPESAQGKRIRGIDHRAHLIQRDLRIALKLVELNSLNPSLSKAILITHLLIAQDEVRRKLGMPEEATTLVGLSEIAKWASVRLAEPGTDPEAEVLVLEPNPEAWEPFAEEFFNAMDLLAAICIAAGDTAAACNVRISMTSKMVMAGMPPDKLLLSQCNTGSLLYFQAELLQAEEQQLRRKFAESAGVDYARVKAIHDPLQPISVGAEEADDIRSKIAEAVSPEDRATYELVVAGKDKLIQMAINTYESVISGLKQLPPDVVKDNVTIAETVALATYGLGVVNLHLSQYDKAERLLREARVRSKACGYEALIDEIERELEKLFNERKTLLHKPDPISMDIRLTKRVDSERQA